MKHIVGAILLLGCSSAPRKPVKHEPVVVAPPAATPVHIDLVRPPPTGGAKPAPILETLATELDRSMAVLAKHEDPPYFLSYELTDGYSVGIFASFGVIERSSESHHRGVGIDVRVGDKKLDNTHALLDRYSAPGRNAVFAVLPKEDDDYAMRSTLWLDTDEAYKRAAEQLTKVRANAQVKLKADDPSDDFSTEAPVQYYEPPATLAIDKAAWEKRLQALSLVFRRHPELTTAGIGLAASADTHYYASSEGTRYQTPEVRFRITINASIRADDGMDLSRFEAFDTSPDKAPTDDQIRAKIEAVITDLKALREAPVAEPYIGPAILEGKAAGVFFHEVFGHRIEGHRQKHEEEGQTFAKKIGQPIMPDFMNVYDDPTIAAINGREVNGFYRYDNEGVVAQQASLVEHGVLKTFLLGRSPTRGFVKSNGHGRRREGMSAVPRQGNLVVAPSRTVDRATLRKMLLDEAKKQGKPYGLVMRELDGGFTMTTRFEAQSFKLLPVMVYRLYPDGHEELVRGADLEGTPLQALADILAAGDDVETFNGYCGAESGFVPVSASSPSLLVAHVELAKKARGQDKPPILPPPPMKDGGQ